MAENSKIEWTDHTFNPWIGCTKVSPGCANCYAETLMDKRLGQVNWGKGSPRKRTGESNWNKPLKWDKDAQKAGRRLRVFCASLADVFDPEVPDDWRDDLFELTQKCKNIDWLILTKRPQLMAYYFLGSSGAGANAFDMGVWDNLWLGTSAEDQTRWDERIPVLMSIPAKVRFVSAEPLLGPIEMGEDRPEWLIVGGESAPGARPISDRWVRSLEKQSRQHGSETAFFFKQWGGVNKKETGRELDGAIYSEFPLNTEPSCAEAQSTDNSNQH